jgi:hypothetical protein
MPFPILAAANVALGAYQAIKGAQGLKRLNQEARPEYSVSPEMQSAFAMAKDRTRYGYDPRQAAAFKQGVAQQQNTGFQQGVSMAGGNLAQALRTGFKVQNIGALNRFASDDAGLQAANINRFYGLASQLQQQKNLIQGERISRRNALEGAYGGAVKSGLNNIASSLNLTQAMGSGLFGEGFVGGNMAQKRAEAQAKAKWYADAELPETLDDVPDLNNMPSTVDAIPDTNWKAYKNATKIPFE